MEQYQKRRSQHSSKSSSLIVAAATDDTTLITARSANHTIFIQKLYVAVTTGSAGKTWTFKDSAGTPVLVVGIVDAATGHLEVFDFGPDGMPLTAGKNFLLDVSAAGALGSITWDAYEKLTASVAPATTN